MDGRLLFLLKPIGRHMFTSFEKLLSFIPEIISSLEDMSIRESSDVFCLGHDSDWIHSVSKQKFLVT